MFIDGRVDPQTLAHVPNTYDQMETGRLNKNQGVHLGLDYMTNKYRLPKDFFNREAVDKLHKQ